MRLVLLMSTALLLSACSGGDGEKAAYVEQANAVCSDTREEFEALTVPTTADGFAPYAEQLVGLVEKAQTELTALTPPEADRQELEDRVFTPLEGLVDEGNEYVEKVRAADGDQAKLLPLLSQRPSADEIDTDFLREYGADTCADAVEAVE